MAHYNSITNHDASARPKPLTPQMCRRRLPPPSRDPPSLPPLPHHYLRYSHHHMMLDFTRHTRHMRYTCYARCSPLSWPSCSSSCASSATLPSTSAPSSAPSPRNDRGTVMHNGRGTVMWLRGAQRLSRTRPIDARAVSSSRSGDPFAGRPSPVAVRATNKRLNIGERR